MPDAKILIVEDEAIEAMDIQQRLAGMGYPLPDIAYAGEEGVKKVEEAQPDLVLMDIMMPGEIDGITAAEQIRSRFDIPIIFLTAYADEKTLQRAKITTPYGYIVKPFHERELHITIETALYRHKMEKELRESEKWLATTLKSIGDAVIATDEKGLITFMNPVAEKLMGWKLEEVRQRNLTEVFNIVNKDTRKRVENPVTKVMLEGNIVGLANHTVLISRDGKEIPISDSAAPIKDEKGNILGIILVFSDITERVNAQETLRRAKQEWERTFDSVPDLIAIMDDEHRIVRVNQAMAERLGCTAEECIGKVCYRSVHDTDSPPALCPHVLTLADGNEHTAEIHEERLGGDFLVTTTPLLDENGKRIGTVHLARDITERKKMEMELEKNNAELEKVNRLKDEFMASMSHELRTPISGVLGLCEILSGGIYGTLNERQLEALENIDKSGRHLLSLINDILDVSKIVVGRLELEIRPVSVKRVCEESLRFVEGTAQKKHLRVSISFDSAVKMLDADELRLTQILVNLLSNAVKFTGEGGSIGLEVEGDSGNELVRFTVWDTGIGISQENMSKLFQPFVQLDGRLSRRYTGTGLGLALARQLSELHGGSISVESEEGKGSNFTVVLPWRVSCEAEDETEIDTLKTPKIRQVLPTGNSGPGQKPLVLLADDSEITITSVSAYLSADGCRVAIARDGEEAIELARECVPDIILMDIQMPDIDGLEAIRIIRSDAKLSNIPIIALTALAMPGDRERCLLAGADDYVSKPFSLSDLSKLIALKINKR